MRVERLNSDQLLQLIIKEDSLSKQSRLRRARFVENLFGRGYGMLLFGGPFSADALMEAKLCYIYGQFIGCILLSQVFFEQYLGGALGLTDVAGEGLATLSKNALTLKWITPAEFSALTKLRRLRNRYTHHQRPRMFWEFAQRVSGRKEYWTVYEEDARLALRTFAGFLLRELRKTKPDS
jgi:hypothetical protein